MTMLTPRDRLIVALDLPSVEDAEAMAASLGDAVSFYKIGLQLFPVGAAEFARRLSDAGRNVFLDFKLLDIGATVEKATRSVRQLNVDFLTVHADHDAIAAAAQGRGDDERLKILAVTVLTSQDQEAIERAGYQMSVEDLVLRRADIALQAGADGLVASPHEAAALRARFGDEFEIVTPGVRPAGAATGDQKRVATPAEALKAGATRLVVGRPITEAAEPAAAARAILTEMAET
ncbi:MAG: orotidine-5'-phosphate decarboxylase [Pseudomonadota bacterium]